MSKYTNDTFKSIWLMEDWNGKNYRILKNLKGEYKVFYDEDVEEVSYMNYVVKKDYKKITGIFSQDDYYFEAQANYLHSNVKHAICCPCGLDVYKPQSEVFHYMLKGKILTRDEWIEKIKHTDSWIDAMTSMLGPHNKSDLPN